MRLLRREAASRIVWKWSTVTSWRRQKAKPLLCCHSSDFKRIKFGIAEHAGNVQQRLHRRFVDISWFGPIGKTKDFIHALKHGDSGSAAVLEHIGARHKMQLHSGTRSPRHEQKKNQQKTIARSIAFLGFIIECKFTRGRNDQNILLYCRKTHPSFGLRVAQTVPILLKGMFQWNGKAISRQCNILRMF